MDVKKRLESKDKEREKIESQIKGKEEVEKCFDLIRNNCR